MHSCKRILSWSWSLLMVILQLELLPNSPVLEGEIAEAPHLFSVYAYELHTLFPSILTLPHLLPISPQQVQCPPWLARWHQTERPAQERPPDDSPLGTEGDPVRPPAALRAAPPRQEAGEQARVQAGSPGGREGPRGEGGGQGGGALHPARVHPQRSPGRLPHQRGGDRSVPCHGREGMALRGEGQEQREHSIRGAPGKGERKALLSSR